MLKINFGKVLLYTSCFLILGIGKAKKAEADIGARIRGMGGAGVSVADDALAVDYNPAGLAYAKEATATLSSLSSGHVGFLSGFLSYVKPFPGLTAAASIIVETKKDKTFSYQLSLAKNLTDKFAAGITTKYFDHGKPEHVFEQESKEFGNIDFDVGLLYKINTNIKAGLKLQNCLGEKGVNRLFKIRPGISFSKGKTTIALDYDDALWNDKNLTAHQRFRYGIEQKIAEAFAARLGSYKTKFTAGVGYKKGKWQIDVAIIPSQEKGYIDWKIGF